VKPATKAALAGAFLVAVLVLIALGPFGHKGKNVESPKR
jgi:hypothetical protein